MVESCCFHFHTVHATKGNAAGDDDDDCDDFDVNKEEEEKIMILTL